MVIHVEGAREHNLRGIDVEFGAGLTVVTGVSGSGKTSLVFDTVYHESRRRYLEAFSLGAPELQLQPAAVDAIHGLGPAVAVGQNLLNRNPGSTLATAAGLHPFLRLLYARYGERSCAHCGSGLSVLSEDEIVARLVAAYAEGEVSVFAPLVRRALGSHRMLLETLSRAVGIRALRIDGQATYETEGTSFPPTLDPRRPHDIDVLLAHWSAPASVSEARSAYDMAAALGAQAVTLHYGGGQITLARAPVCLECGAWFEDLEPIHFHRACPTCAGAGCAQCAGTGLEPRAAAVRWQGLRLPELLARPVSAVQRLVEEAPLPEPARRLADEIRRRLEALAAVGMGYLALDRPSPTLSRGEAQRVRLAVALTSRLEDMLHVLDEPTVGLHPADVARLIPAFRRLAGPTIFVEHDRVAAAQADHALDIGPGAGSQGGTVTFSGTPAALWDSDTASGRYFSLRERAAIPPLRPPPEGFLTLRGAHLRNLQAIDVALPLARLTVITGVSGSGKSTLVEDVLVASLASGTAQGCTAFEGPRLAALLVNQDPIGLNPRSNPATYTKLGDLVRDYFAQQTALSASHFSFNRPEGACPACAGMGAIEVAMRYLPSTWAPCAACGGQRFSDEVLAACAPFGARQLSIAEFLALSVAEAQAALAEAVAMPAAARRAAIDILAALHDVGLGYLPLGQPSPSLSGGEAQRVKLARYLGRGALAGKLLVLDEPSTGLHPQDVSGLLIVLDRLCRRGATVVVVEHNTDLIRAADWVIDLGPGAGPEGGRLLYAGPPAGLEGDAASPTGAALRAEAELRPRSATEDEERMAPASTSPLISIRGARAHNLRNIDVDFAKQALTVVTGVSGSGKSSLVGDVLEAEARRRFLDTLSMYERQGIQEGPEAPVDQLSGLGVTLAVTGERRMYNRRSTVGTASEVSYRLAALFSALGERRCVECGASMQRSAAGSDAALRGERWRCPTCGAEAPLAEPRHFSGATYAAACLTCHGVGTLQMPNPAKLIIHPELPLCGGAMHSPGFFPKGYLCEPFNGGYDVVQAVAERYGFDPRSTPWVKLSPAAQHAFLHGDPEPLTVCFRSRTRESTRTITFGGFYDWIRDWDVGGTYTDTLPCPACGGARLRPEYLSVTLAGHDVHALNQMPLAKLAGVLERLPEPTAERVRLAGPALAAARRRLRFLTQVGLGYLHLDRPTATLSAGEAQRIRLAGLLGSGLTALTVLLDEPTRGLHPGEVNALLAALAALRDEGNTVILVEHDLAVMHAADHIVDMGPGAGRAGGQVVAQGSPAAVAASGTLTGQWLRGERKLPPGQRRTPAGWMVVRGARANNLRSSEVRLPLGVLFGVCGVSGSGKSTLMIDTVGRALAPVKQTTSVAHEPIAPGEHDSIEGAPLRTLVVDQARAGVVSPAVYLDLERPLRALYAAGDEARALGLDEKALAQKCSACGGHGTLTTDMGFLPAVHTPCETCRGSGCSPEAWHVRLQGVSLPEALSLTIDEVYATLGTEPALERALAAARAAGLGYLTLRQPGRELSGGEAQRLKIARELSRRVKPGTLYLLDEPTVGQHPEDVARLAALLHRLVDEGHSVAVVEHHTYLLAACDWLLELGPGGGPEGGQVVAEGLPEVLAQGDTPSAPFIRALLAAANE